MNKLTKVTFTKIFNLRITNKFSVNIWVLLVFLCSLWGGYYIPFLLAYICALLHELAHILTAKAMNISVSELIIYPFGINARLNSSYIRSSEKEFVIAFVGPFMNILLVFIGIMLNNFIPSKLSVYFTDLNLLMCALNLIPTLPLDGGRMLKSILTTKYGIIRAYNFMIKLSRIIIIVLLLLAFLYFFVSDFNFSLVLISAFLLQNLCIEQQTISIIALKEILNNRSKLAENREYPVKNLCVCENTCARTLLKHLTYDYYYIVHIIDAESKITKTITETEVLSTLTQKGIRIRYKDI